jgi:hypothetical protein
VAFDEEDFMSPQDDLIELVDYVRNHVDSFRILEIKVAAIVATLEAAEKDNRGLYTSYMKHEKLLERAYLDKRDDAGVRLRALEARLGRL